jgi:hypothetical protein
LIFLLSCVWLIRKSRLGILELTAQGVIYLRGGENNTGRNVYP